MPRSLCAGLVVCLALLWAGPARADEQQLVGHWQGKLKLGAFELRLALNFEKDKDGKLKGTLDSLDQGANDIPIDEIQVKDADVTLAWKKLKASFEGKTRDDGKALEGKWKQGGLSFDLTFNKLDRRAKLVRPQEPKRPYPYKSEEVTFENKEADGKLAGTLTLPKGGGPFPAAVLLSGSGPQDRDEFMLGHKPFLVLADHLTRNGIAVLRFDDRGVGGSTGDTLKSTIPDNASDALAAVSFLKTRKEIDPRGIGLIGHSEGGIAGPLAASKSKDVAFVVMLAGTGLPGEDILYLQGRHVVEAAGGSAEEIAMVGRMQKTIFTILKEEKDDSKAKEKIGEAVAKLTAELTEEQKKELAGQKDLAEAQLKLVFTPWFRHFIGHDPREALRKLRVPVLALVGERDVQVPPKENLAGIGAALKEAGNDDVTLKELPGLNHLFQTAKTGAVSEYGGIEETFAPAALEVISEWIVQRVGNAKSNK